MSDEHLVAAQQLADVLARENDALKRLDFVLAAALVPAKDAALADFMKLPKTSAPRMAALGRRLGGLAAENQILLERAIAVQTRLIRIVARALAPPPALTCYNGYNPRAASNRAAAVALSTRA